MVQKLPRKAPVNSLPKISIFRFTDYLFKKKKPLSQIWGFGCYLDVISFFVSFIFNKKNRCIYVSIHRPHVCVSLHTHPYILEEIKKVSLILFPFS